ncbi:MAG: hypothetical protein A2Y07_10870 [Planctomycetes bacterium GWF2_50_10]|nr:MAG: hypothetical protein A2Y07_10870 [Planctomycetes bacterium GWF2_50_10]
MSEIRYICTGPCGTEVTEDQFLAGQSTCEDETCDQYGEPLEKVMYCGACDVYYKREAEHAGHEG